MLLDIIGFLLVFGLLAALIGTLVSEATWRYIGFGVLVFFAIAIGRPIVQGAAFTAPFVQPQRPQLQSPARASQQNTPLRVQPAAVGGPTEGTRENRSGSGVRVLQGNTLRSTTISPTTTQRRGVRAMW